jgi:hypothetical protein
MREGHRERVSRVRSRALTGGGRAVNLPGALRCLAHPLPARTLLERRTTRTFPRPSAHLQHTTTEGRPVVVPSVP